jgi:hypothetical protein
MEEHKNISDEEIKKIQSEIAAKQAEELSKLSESKAKEVEERVRKEMEAKMEAERLKAELAKQSEALKKLQEEQEIKMKAQQEAFEKRLQELEGQKKGIAKNESPFNSQSSNPNIKVIDGIPVDLSKLDHAAIEEQSRQEWMKFVGIKDPNWGTPYR